MPFDLVQTGIPFESQFLQQAWAKWGSFFTSLRTQGFRFPPVFRPKVEVGGGLLRPIACCLLVYAALSCLWLNFHLLKTMLHFPSVF